MRKIFVTAGHNRNDAGAVYNGIKESELTIELRDLICDETDFFKDHDSWNNTRTIGWLQNNKSQRDVNADIHFNAAVNPLATGVEVLVANNASATSRNLAKLICDELSEILGIRNRGVKTESQSARGRLGIVNVRGISILIEVCFLSNPSDVNAYLKNKDAVALCIRKNLEALQKT